MTNKPAKIVVGVDGSDGSAKALAWATSLAESSGATVTAVKTWSYPTAMIVPMVGAPALPADFMADTSAAQLGAMVEANPSSIDVDERVIMGAARAALCELSSEHDLLVLGRTGNSRIKRMWLGSTASHCVRHSDCPVVNVGESTAPETTITVAVDGSETSVSALAWALGLGDDHDIVAVYSHDEWELDDLPLDAEIRAKLDSSADGLLEQAVSAAVERAGGGGDRIKRQVRQGDPRTTVVDQGDAAELLVLGAQGHSGIARWALGSLADYAVHHASGSVAIWR